MPLGNATVTASGCKWNHERLSVIVQVKYVFCYCPRRYLGRGGHYCTVTAAKLSEIPKSFPSPRAFQQLSKSFPIPLPPSLPRALRAILNSFPRAFRTVAAAFLRAFSELSKSFPTPLPLSLPKSLSEPLPLPFQELSQSFLRAF